MPAKPFDLNSVSPEDLLVMVREAGGQRKFTRLYGVKRSNLQRRLYKLRNDPYQHRPRPQAREIMPEGGRRRFLISSAQDASKVDEDFLFNLEAYCAYLSNEAPCEILIGPFTYSKRLFEDHATTSKDVYFHERVKPYLVHDRVRIADRLDFCGEMNTLPTAENPLSGFHTYTRQRWGIFPHAKVQLVSVPTMKHTPAKMIMTTGAVTKPNYIPKKAGIKASFHHVIGAVIVEVDDDGTFFCRHIIADADGSFYDLDRHVDCGEVSTGNRVRALTPGDIHVAQIDPEVAQITFGVAPTPDRNPIGGRTWMESAAEPSMVGRLNPEHLLIHDASDFHARNHHDIADPHKRYEHFVHGRESVETELREVSAFLDVLDRRFRDTLVTVVDSNHDQALVKWLKFADYRYDPVNALFFLRCQMRLYQAIQERENRFSIFEDVMRGFAPHWCENVQFLREDDTFVIDEVEHANHGHRGPNGSRGSVQALTKIGPKISMGHVHSCAIQDGVYAAGTSSLLDLSYNAGPSSWSHSHIVQYLNGKRAIITIQNGRWRL